MPTELETLLTLRREAERAAEARLAQAVSERERQEAIQAGLVRSWQVAQEGVRIDRERSAPVTAGSALARERYRHELDRKAAQAQAHRLGALAAAQRVEEEARAAWVEARRAREAADKLEQRAQGEAKKLAGRRAERAADEVAMATYLRRRPDHR